MDNKLLLDLFHIPSQSTKEKPMRDFLADYLTKINIPFFEDDVGNIYNISHKNKPLLSSHMDTVQDNNDILMSKFINLQNGIVKGYGIIGGDDKCGIYSILDLLKNGHDDVNFLFTIGEEIGGMGSNKFVSTNDLEHILYGLILDRRGSGDIICSNNNYGTKYFEEVLTKMGSNFGYAPSTGTFSDADFISSQLSCANLSVGYYNAHSKNEYVKISELQNSINYTHAIIKNLDIKFDKPPVTKSRDIYGFWANDGYSYPNDGAKEPCEVCGSTEYELVYLRTLQANICQFCVGDLLNELAEVQYSYDLDGFEDFSSGEARNG